MFICTCICKFANANTNLNEYDLFVNIEFRRKEGKTDSTFQILLM